MSYQRKQTYFGCFPPACWISSFKMLPFVLALCASGWSMHVVAGQIPNDHKYKEDQRYSKQDEALRSTDSSKQVDANSTQYSEYQGCSANANNRDVRNEADPQGGLSLDIQFENKNIKHFKCLSSVRHVFYEWNRNNNLILDIRRSKDFNKYQIPGSINLAGYAIKSKSFLKDKNIVLVNEGRYLSQMEDLCNSLKDIGFQHVTVMDGGLYAWHQAGHPLTGEMLEISKLNRISPSEWISALHERDWRFIDLDQALPSLSNLLPKSAVIDYQADKGAFIADVNQANTTFQMNMPNGFLVVSHDGDDYRSIERLLKLTDAKNVFYLTGGISQFKRYLNTHSSLLLRLSKGFKEPHRCNG